jgi:hypothetical protein
MLILQFCRSEGLQASTFAGKKKSKYSTSCSMVLPLPLISSGVPKQLVQSLRTVANSHKLLLPLCQSRFTNITNFVRIDGQDGISTSGETFIGFIHSTCIPNITGKQVWEMRCLGLVVSLTVVIHLLSCDNLLEGAVPISLNRSRNALWPCSLQCDLMSEWRPFCGQACTTNSKSAQVPAFSSISCLTHNGKGNLFGRCSYPSPISVDYFPFEKREETEWSQCGCKPSALNVTVLDTIGVNHLALVTRSRHRGAGGVAPAFLIMVLFLFGFNALASRLGPFLSARTTLWFPPPN